MHHHTRRALACAALGLLAASGPVRALQVCELNGESVNPNNGNTTTGKSGLMRCREGDGGPVVREQELQRGVFMGAVRYFNSGVLEKDFRVNERGNRDGIAREYAKADAGGKPVLVREETYRDGRTVGIARAWYPNGQLRRVTSYGDAEREQAYAEFTPQGQLYELRCAPKALLAPDVDDAKLCGFSGGASVVTLYGGKGVAREHVSYDRGELRKSESLWDSGAPREVRELDANGGTQRSFAADGTKRREQQWSLVSGERNRRVTTLDREFHESGKLVREQRWKVGERGAEPVSDERWYLNGQPKELVEYISDAGRAARRDTEFHDNGKKASEGLWLLASGSRDRSEVPTGVHRQWDADGHLRGESTYDERGRVNRERELDANGTVVRDDAVFEDGSRKAFGR